MKRTATALLIALAASLTLVAPALAHGQTYPQCFRAEGCPRAPMGHAATATTAHAAHLAHLEHVAHLAAIAHWRHVLHLAHVAAH